MEKTIEQNRNTIQEFANRFKLVFEDEGEVGFGRECVGLLAGENYVDYNPTKFPDYEDIEELYDERLFSIVPVDAYHKHNCIAVLGRGEEAIEQLANWVISLNELGAEVVTYNTGATGIQAMLTGATGKAIKLPPTK